jgi:long-subunit fatty acid transport protein
MTKRLILIVFILFSVITTAQERTSSPYSFYGVGLNTFRGTVENKSMGGISFFSDSIHLNLRNPAAYGRLRLTNYSLGASNSSVDFESDAASGSANTASFDYLAIGIPTNKFGFGFGLIPYSAVGYNILNVEEDGSRASRFSGKGGVNKVFLSAGFEINENISLGAEVNYNFGNIQNKNLLVQENIQFATREINRSDLSGFSYTFGLDYQRMLNDKLELKFGAHYTPKADLNSENLRELATVQFNNLGGEGVVDARDVDLADTDLELPDNFSVGTGIGRPRNWFVGAEYVRTGAGNFSNRSFSLEGASYREANSYRVGGYYIPDYSSLTSYFNRIVYRAGVRMEETGLVLQGEAIDEFGISFGVGLPAGRVLSNVNLGIEYGQRGTTNAGLVKENFFNAMISLSLNDRWFVRRRFE